jgi:hypothetical protein
VLCPFKEGGGYPKGRRPLDFHEPGRGVQKAGGGSLSRQQRRGEKERPGLVFAVAAAVVDLSARQPGEAYVLWVGLEPAAVEAEGCL